VRQSGSEVFLEVAYSVALEDADVIIDNEMQISECRFRYTNL
jgi:hypothetical protein